MANVTFADDANSSNPAPRPLPRRDAATTRSAIIDATPTETNAGEPAAPSHTLTSIVPTELPAKSTTAMKTDEAKDGGAQTTITEVPSMQSSEPYIAKSYGGSGIDQDDFDRLIDFAEAGESCCRCCGMRFGKNDLIRAVPIPIVAPIVGHLVASEISEDAEKLGVPASITDMMEGQARCLCCLSVFWLPGIFIGACLKRKRLNPASILRTFRAVYANPSLYNESSKPMDAAEAFTRRMYGSKT